MTTIIGAGLTGLIAAHAWPTAPVLERSKEPTPAHAALLRFRSDAVANLTGIEFRPVRVHKGIWDGNALRGPNIRLANMYAQKCLGRLDSGDRSIWHLQPSDRWIAPDNFHERLVDSVGKRIKYGVDAGRGVDRWLREPVVSTIPLEFMAKLAGVEHRLALQRSPITVTRFRLPNTDLFQTIYFPGDRHNCYRASITGATLICEHAGSPEGTLYLEDVTKAFGLRGTGGFTSLGVVEQAYGKIAAEPNDAARKHVLFQITQALDVYSLGRFATWRNILLDDVVKDILVIKRMMAGGSYNQRLAL